eukprot:COSAG06_NODE_544_length_14458_cov_18.391671_9_plen_118_part_00
MEGGGGRGMQLRGNSCCVVPIVSIISLCGRRCHSTEYRNAMSMYIRQTSSMSEQPCGRLRSSSGVVSAAFEAGFRRTTRALQPPGHPLTILVLSIVYSCFWRRLKQLLGPCMDSIRC